MTTNLAFSQWLNDHEYKEGLSLAIKSDFNESKVAFEKALSLDPKNSQIEIALNVCSDIIDGKISESAAILFFKGNEKFRKCKYDKAIEYYKDAIKDNPLFAEAHYNIGVSNINKGIIAGYYNGDGIDDFNKAISINPDFYMAYIKRSESYMMSGQFENAISGYESAVKIQPNKTDLYNNLVLCYAKLDKLTKANEIAEDNSQYISDDVRIAIEIIPPFEKKLKKGLTCEEVQDIIHQYFLYSCRSLMERSKNNPFSIKLKDGTFIFINGLLESWDFDEKRVYDKRKKRKELERNYLLAKYNISPVKEYYRLARWEKVKYYIAWSPFNKTKLTDLDRPKEGGVEDAGMAGGWSLGFAIPVSKHFTLRNDFKYNSRFPRIDDSTNYNSEGGPICELQYLEIIPKLTYSIPSSPFSNFYFSTGFEYRYLLSAKIQPVDNISGPEGPEATDIMNSSDVSSYALQLGIGYQWGIPKREIYGFIEFSYSYGFPTKINGTKTSITTINFISLGLGFY